MLRNAGALCAVLALALSAFMSFSALADDTSAGVVLPGLRSAPPGKVVATSASVSIKEGDVQVSLALAASSDAAALALEMPKFGWLGESDPYPDRQFPELRAAVNGAPAQLLDSFSTFFRSDDVTELLRSAGLDPFAIADTPPFVSRSPEGAAAFDRLVGLGAIRKAGGNYLAAWTAQRHLKIQVEPGPARILALNYQARPGYGLLGLEQPSLGARLALYCLDVPLLRSLTDRKTHVTAWEYSIPAGIDDNPVESVAVEIGPPSKVEGIRSLTAFCGRDGKPVIGRTAETRGTARTDPKGILHILSVGSG